MSPHLRAVFQALLVTFIWSLSWVLIKIGLADIPALTFAGLRYVMAFLCLLPLAWRRGDLATLRGLSRPGWRQLILLGLIYYTITQGSQFVTLNYLPAVTFSLLLNFSAVLVALLGITFLSERLTGQQWFGMALFFAGVLVYFYPVAIPAGQGLGYLVAAISVSANALSSVIGRAVNRDSGLPPLAVTTVSMGAGGGVLLLAGLLTQGLPPLGWQSWLLIAWLAVVHTAFTFNLWNHTLRTLSAAESSIINNTMLIQIALLAWLFLGESLNAQSILGLVIAAGGIFLFQFRRRQPPAGKQHSQHTAGTALPDETRS